MLLDEYLRWYCSKFGYAYMWCVFVVKHGNMNISVTLMKTKNLSESQHRHGNYIINLYMFNIKLVSKSKRSPNYIIPDNKQKTKNKNVGKLTRTTIFIILFGIFFSHSSSLSLARARALDVRKHMQTEKKAH